MKATILIVLAMSLLGGVLAFAERQQDPILWVAIDDGTENRELFINLDGETYAAGIENLRLTKLSSLQGVNEISGIHANAITIISNDELDYTTKEKIETVLSSSGHTGVVVFVDRNSTSSMEMDESN